jgi:hypothetical protein
MILSVVVTVTVPMSLSEPRRLPGRYAIKTCGVDIPSLLTAKLFGARSARTRKTSRGHVTRRPGDEAVRAVKEPLHVNALIGVLDEVAR